MTDERVTMAQIARAAGVSVTTVSRALQDDPRVQGATRTRIQDLAHRMGYQRDPALSALVDYRRDRVRRREPPKIALLLTPGYAAATVDGEDHRSRHLYGIARAADEHYLQIDQHVIMASEHADALHDAVATIQSPYLIAVGLQPDCLADPWFAERTTIVIGMLGPHSPLHRVDSDCAQGMALAFEHARQLGYHRIGLAMHPHTDRTSGGHWYAAYHHQQLLAERDGLPPLPICTHPGDTLHAWLRDARPDCVLTRLGLRQELAAAGRRAGVDIGYIGLGVHRAGYRTTGLVSNAETVGRAAVLMLDMAVRRREAGFPPIPLTTLVPYRWNDGCSVPPRHDQ